MKGGGVWDEAAYQLLHMTDGMAHTETSFLLYYVVIFFFSFPFSFILRYDPFFSLSLSLYPHFSHSIVISLSRSIFLSTFINPSCYYISNSYYAEIQFLLSVTYFLVQII